MVTPPAPLPQPRQEGRVPIPTPADLRHPRQRTVVTGTRTDDPADAASASQSPAEAGDSGECAPVAGTDLDAEAEVSVGRGEAPAARPRDSPPAMPTPATLPRPSRPGTGAEGLVLPVPVEPAARRIFPNPATLMASGRGRKVRASSLRGRRLPKVEETSAGGVVLDLSRRPAAVALIARHDRRSRLLWSLPKGHVEEGETPEQAALREVREETGLLGRIVAPLGVIDFWFVVEDKRIHKTVHHFVIEAIGGELSDSDLEVEAVEWIPYDQVVRKLAYGDERRLVEKVAQIVPGVR